MHINTTSTRGSAPRLGPPLAQWRCPRHFPLLVLGSEARARPHHDPSSTRLGRFQFSLDFPPSAAEDHRSVRFQTVRRTLGPPLLWPSSVLVVRSTCSRPGPSLSPTACRACERRRGSLRRRALDAPPPTSSRTATTTRPPAWTVRS